MKRASYREAIEWIAQNDSAGVTPDNADVEAAQDLITAVLVAEIFGVEPAEVGRDIVRRRKMLGIIP